MDAYELPDRLREAVRLLAPADVFPYAAPQRRASTSTTPCPTTRPRPAGAERHWSTRWATSAR